MRYIQNYTDTIKSLLILLKKAQAVVQKTSRKNVTSAVLIFFFFFSVFLIDVMGGKITINLNTICHLLALLGAHHILHVSRIRVKRTVPKIKKKRKRHMHTRNELDAH